MLTEEEEKIRLQLVKIVKHLRCSICLNLMVSPSMTQCLHRFCNECICQSIRSSKSDYCRCPLCNEKITKRSLREQSELSLVIDSVKRVVQLFETDNQLTSIMSPNDIVVFDASTDKSISNDESEGIDQQNISKDCVKEINHSQDIIDIESNRKSSLPSTISVSDDCWPTCEDSIPVNESNNETKDMTDLNINNNTSVDSNNDSLQENSINAINGLNKLSTDEGMCSPVLTQSQKMCFLKSRITYSTPHNTTRTSADIKFDQIMSKVQHSNNQFIQTKDQIKQNGFHNVLNQPKLNTYGKECLEKDQDECEDVFYPLVEAKNIQRKPLTQLKRLQNNERHDKQKFKRVQRFDSSDEDIDSPVIVNRKRKAQKIRESEPFENVSKEPEKRKNDMSDDDLLMTSIHVKKNATIDMNSTSVSLLSYSRDGYQSDTQLITSSPSFDFN